MIKKALSTQEEIAAEYNKCKENPYYFATTYLEILDLKGFRHKFETPLSEKEFNKMILNYE